MGISMRVLHASAWRRLLGVDVFGVVTAAAVRRRWLTLGLWLAAAGVLFAGVPSLEQVASQAGTGFVPATSPSLHGLRVMDDAFGSGRARSFVTVVLTDRHGIGRADERAYARVVSRLRGDPRVAEVQDYISQPVLRKALVSRDGQATFIPVGLRHPFGSAQAITDVTWLRGVVHAAPLPAGASWFVTGDPAMLADLNNAVNEQTRKVTLVTVGLLAIILLAVYRRLLTPLIPLATIGVAIVCIRGVVALLGLHGMALSTFTGPFMTAIVFGAGTDYSVFLISRYQEQLRAGADPRDAVRIAGSRIGKVLAASAGTVIIGSVCMAFARLSLFNTTGPAIAVAVAVTALVSLTLTPALLAWAGHRAGGRQAGARGWARAGAVVARRPAAVLAAGLVLLSALAVWLPTMHPSFDERALQPADTPSNRGLQALAAHFPRNEVLPDYLLIQSRHDMRDPRDLATVEQLTRTVDKVPGVTEVNSVTEPAGQPIPQANLAHQVGALASQLNQARTGLSQGTGGIDRLSAGAGQFASGAGQLANGTQRASSAVDQFIAGLTAETNGLTTASDGSGTAGSGAAQLASGARALADGMQTAHDQTATAVGGLHLIAVKLDADPVCTTDPVCRGARQGLTTIYQGENDQLLPGLQRAADGARQIADGNGQLAGALSRLHAGLVQASQGTARLADGERTFGAKLGQLAGGAGQLATGAAQLPAGLGRLTTATGQLSGGLGAAASYLHGVNQQAATPDAGGFYLPPSAFNDPRFALARQMFISPDGHTARLEILTARDPLSDAGMSQFAAATGTAHTALHRTSLAGANILPTGAAGLGTDLSNYLAADGPFVVAAVLLAVFLILAITLRALVAPVYRLASVVLSYAAAMGLTTLVFQHALGHGIDSGIPVIDFVILVAVGADYNIFLMSRLREHSRIVTRTSVAQAVAATGGVITAAGVIFAATFVALMGSPIISLAENGFAVATGLLLDTFIVRTLLVPSTAALLGKHNWWPFNREPRGKRHLAPARRPGESAPLR
jgi:RND superfamily putative drug exporter